MYKPAIPSLLLPLSLALLASSFAGLGCGEPDEQASLAEGERICRPDAQDLLAAPSVCADDLECPCGTFCDLGACVAQCTSTADCSGDLRCDSFGRCQSEEDFNRSGRRASNEAGELVLSESDFTIYSEDRSRTLRVGARYFPIQRVRLQAEEGLEISCEGAEFSQECLLEDLSVDSDSRREVVIRATDGLNFEEPARRVVRIFSQDQRRSITVGTRPDREQTSTTSGTPGIYRGYAWPEGSGFQSRFRQNEFTDAIRQLRIPVTIVVYPDEDARYRVAEFEDGLGLLFAEGSTVARFERSSGNPWEVSLPRDVFSSPSAGRETPILVRSQTESVNWRGPLLAIELRATFEGLIPEERAPYVDWKISTTLVEPFEEGEALVPPALTASVEGIHLNEWINSPLPLEEVVGDYFQWELNDFAAPHRYVMALLCNDYPGTPGGLSPAVAAMLGETLLERVPGIAHPAGQLACVNPDLTREATKVFELLNDSVLDVYSNLEGCFEDFQRGELARINGVLDRTAADCIDEPRFVKALTVALHADRARALGDGSASDFRSSALAHRLMQQWLSLHSFIGREFATIDTFNAIVPATEAVDLSVDRREVVDRIAYGFDFFLNPRIAASIAYLSTDLLRNPDYRSALFPGEDFPPQRTHDQTIGLPVALLQTYIEQLRTIGDFLEDVQYRRRELQEIEDTATEAIRQGFLLFSIAQGLYDELRVGGEPSWQAEWELVREQVGSQLTGVIQQLEDTREGVNPLGISDVDLPLYRIGDQQQTIQRFSAVSDFLVGTGPSDPSVAATMVNQARDALELSRQAWSENVIRDVEAQLGDDAQARRLESIQRKYGSQVNGLCGGTGFSSLEVLANADQIDGRTCFVEPQCRFEIGDYFERVSPTDVGLDLCVTALLRDRLGPSVTSNDAAMDEVLDQLAEIYQSRDGGIVTIFRDPLPLSGMQMEVAGPEGTLLEFDLFPSQLERATAQIPAETPIDFMEETQEICEAHRQHGESVRPSEIPDTCRTRNDCPIGFVCQAEECLPEEDRGNDDPACYSGALGEMALEVRSLATAVDIARSKLQEFSERYDNAMQSCMIQTMGNELRAETQSAHDRTMVILGGAKLMADSTAQLAKAGRQSAGIDSIFTFAATAVFAFGEALATIASQTLAFSMESLERSHGRTMAAIDAQVAQATCYNDAEMHLIGARSASLDLQRATQDLAQQLVAFDGLRGSVEGLLTAGLQELRTETERTRAPLDIDFWIDDRIDSYQRYMRAARRTVYLAVMAVEYEYQFSSAERAFTLAAETPDDLERVLTNLRAFTMTGSIRGANPGELLAVVSLRDHLLQLADRKDLPDGFYEMSASEQFRAILTSSRYAVYKDGVYRGQEIPFQLAPMGQQGLGSYQGIPLLAGTDCAERLWSANLSLHGQDLYRGDQPSFSRVVLKKRNTFFSQWCGEPGDENPHQLASTRPSRNLFLDPYAREESTTPVTIGFSGGDETDAFSNARISAYFNVPRQVMEEESYTQGQSRELAGRGLYGDYAIFFPAEILSREGSTGLVLDNLEDIYLRVDYVSVAR